MSDNNQTGAFLVGFFIGGLFGAAAALLMTPQSGEQTRLQLQERSIELKSQAGDLAAGARGQAGQTVTGIQERGKALIDQRRQADDTSVETSTDEKEPATGEEEES
jgi:gas vesicle protein